MEIEDLDEIYREYLHVPPSNNFNDEDNDNINDNENNELEDTEPVEHISETDEIAQAAAAFVEHHNGDNICINNEGLNMAKITGDCGCLAKCINQFEQDEIITHILSMRELSKEGKDMYLMGKLKSKGVDKSRSRCGERKRTRYAYTFDDREVCRDVFLLTHDIGESYLKSLLKHMNTNGIAPRKHGNYNRRPKNAFSFEEISNIVQYLKNYARLHGLPQAAPPNRHDSEPQILLPSCESKQSVFDTYKSACQADGTRSVHLTTFKNVWSSCCPHIRFASLHSDVCTTCKRLRESVTLAQTEEEKIETSQNYISHIEAARRERELYNGWLSKSRDEFSNYNQGQVLKNVHYTIDFAQSISLPHHTDQVGQLYFLSGRKVKVFGVCIEGKRKQYNYLVDEDEGILKDCADTKGPNATISMFDHAVECYGLNESECGIHCDNCPGENKNRYMTGYLAWRVLTGQHQKISLMMQFPAHTKCLVDAGFGQAKKLFRRSNCDTVSHLAEVFRKSSSSNEVVQYNQENNETTWQWEDWKSFLSVLFKPVPGIRKYHHFVFRHDKPGIVIVKENCDGIEKEINILRRPLEEFDPLARPEVIPAAGLSRTRHEYLYSKVRPYARKEYQAAFCHAPGEE